MLTSNISAVAFLMSFPSVHPNGSGCNSAPPSQGFSTWSKIAADSLGGSLQGTHACTGCTDNADIGLRMYPQPLLEKGRPLERVSWPTGHDPQPATLETTDIRILILILILILISYTKLAKSYVVLHRLITS